MNAFRKVLAGLCCLFVVGCGSASSGDSLLKGHLLRGDVLVQVESAHWNSGTLYGVPGRSLNSKFKIGFVEGIGEHSFWISIGEYGGGSIINYVFYPTTTRHETVYDHTTGAPFGAKTYPYLFRGVMGVTEGSVIFIKLEAELDQSRVVYHQN